MSDSEVATNQGFGTWDSPIDAASVSSTSLSIEDLLVDPTSEKLYLIEKRPLEGGRSVIVSANGNTDIYGSAWNARTRVHEYGGAPAVAHGGIVYFSNVADLRLYKVIVGEGETEPKAITPANNHLRFADMTVHPKVGKWLVCVCEDHTIDTPASVKNTLVAVDTLSGEIITIASGADFYSNPRYSPDGTYLAWRQWNHPEMPWWRSQITIAANTFDVETGKPSLGPHLRVAGGNDQKISTAEPTWTPNNALIYLSDERGFHNPFILQNISAAIESTIAEPRPISADLIKEDFGEPAWWMGLSSLAILDEHRVVFSSFRNGTAQLYCADILSGAFTALDTPFVITQFLRFLSNGKVVFVGRKADEDGAVVELSVIDNKPVYTVLKPAPPLSFPKEYISLPQNIAITILPDNEPSYLVYYAPKNPAYSGGSEQGELPPVILSMHGGPNSLTDQALSWIRLFWTSRGWAWVDSNYTGSTGYGREYMERLKGQWGKVVVRDSVAAIQQLGTLGLVDPKRAFIRGGSAGGFATLSILADPSGTGMFAAGTASYPASDLETLHSGAHKFQSHFLPQLVGGLLEEKPELWKATSPIHKAGDIKVPILVLHGAVDSVLPAVQSRSMVETIRNRGGTVKYVEYPGEGHGWRMAETVRAALEEELAWYKHALGLK